MRMYYREKKFWENIWPSAREWGMVNKNKPRANKLLTRPKGD